MRTGKIPFLDTTPSFSTAQSALSAQMMGYWTRFARAGNPNGGGAPYWPPFRSASQRIQELIPDATAPEATFGAAHQCGFWAQLEG